jgi:hypothetical protein
MLAHFHLCAPNDFARTANRKEKDQMNEKFHDALDVKFSGVPTMTKEEEHSSLVEQAVHGLARLRDFLELSDAPDSPLDPAQLGDLIRQLDTGPNPTEGEGLNSAIRSLLTMWLMPQARFLSLMTQSPRLVLEVTSDSFVLRGPSVIRPTIGPVPARRPHPRPHLRPRR